MTAAGRIVANTCATYAQTVVSLLMGLLCGRWVYLALGKENYGLFSVVGSIIAFVGFVNSTIVWGSGRFFAHAIGMQRRSDTEPDILCKWINTAFSVQFFLPLLLVSIGGPIGFYYVRHGLVVDPSLRNAALFVYFCSLFTLFQTMAVSPVFALYTAKQYIFVRNAFAVLLSFVFAAEGWWLLHYEGDRIRVHALLSCVIQIVVNLALFALAVHQFREFRIRFRYWFCWKRMREMLAFSLFSLVGALGPLFSNSGVAIVLNRFGGAPLNAAYGAGNQVYSKAGRVSHAMTDAINPEITARVGSGDLVSAERLARRECVYSSALSACIAVPAICFSDAILRLWLKNPPEQASLFLSIMMANLLSERVSSGYSTLIHAKGKIKTYTLTVGLGNASRCFIVIFLLFALRRSLASSLWLGWFLPFLILNQMRIPFSRWLVGIDVRAYLCQVLMPVTMMFLCSFLFCYFGKGVLGESVAAMGAVGLLNVGVVFVITFLLLPNAEKSFLLSKKRSLFTRLSFATHAGD